MAESVVPHFHNEAGVAVIEIGLVVEMGNDRLGHGKRPRVASSGRRNARNIAGETADS